MGLNISNHSGVVVVGTLDVDFTEEVEVTDDGDSTVTLKVLEDRTLTNMNNVRGIL